MRGNKVTAATVVDHIIPHKGDKVLFWDELNWQPMCKPCHDRKTALEDMGKWPGHKIARGLVIEGDFQVIDDPNRPDNKG